MIAPEFSNPYQPFMALRGTLDDENRFGLL